MSSITRRFLFSLGGFLVVGGLINIGLWLEYRWLDQAWQRVQTQAIMRRDDPSREVISTAYDSRLQKLETALGMSLVTAHQKILAQEKLLPLAELGQIFQGEAQKHGAVVDLTSTAGRSLVGVWQGTLSGFLAAMQSVSLRSASLIVQRLNAERHNSIPGPFTISFSIAYQ